MKAHAASWFAAAALAAAPCFAATQPATQPCVKDSPAHTVAVVELYTSEGCNSCPPADQWLGSLRPGGIGYDSVVPLALHVDYWDSLGWKDRFASARFTGRQNRLSELAASKVVYTPEVFLNTRELRGWNTGQFARAVHDINAVPARAAIHIALEPPRDGRLAVRATFRLAEGAQAGGHPQAYLALFENRLSSDVKAGENRGVLLHHEQVVRQWLGPVEFAGGAAQIDRTFVLDADAMPRNLGVAAFVQDDPRREVLQATALQACGV